MNAGSSRILVLLTLGLSLMLAAAVAVRAERGASTARERAKAIRLARQLEAEPFGEKARDARRWLALWAVEVPDFRIQYCPEILGGTMQARQRIRNEILAQTTYSSLAFVLEHPGEADAAQEVYQAGVLGALRVYEAVLAKEPGTRSPLLDDLIAKRNAGELDAYLAETVKACPAVKAAR